MSRPAAALALALLALPALGACGGGDEGQARLCGAAEGIEGELGEIDTGDNLLNLSPMGSNLFLELYLDPAAAEIFDSFRLELYAGLGVFAGGPVKTGTFQLSNAEGLYSSCGACLLLLVDQDLATLTATRSLMPVRGTLTLTSVSGRLTGRLEDVELREVTIDLTDPDGPGPLRPTLATSPVPGGCHVHLGLAAFDVAIEG